MKKFVVGALLASMIVFTFSGCVANKATVGGVTGGAAGALLGSRIGHGSGRIAAVAVGTLLGALVGSSIGASLDRVDEALAARAANQAFEHGRSGSSVPWSNPDNGHSGAITPQSAYRTPEGRYCREYHHTVTVGGRTEQVYGTACRQPNGDWEVVK